MKEVTLMDHRIIKTFALKNICSRHHTSPILMKGKLQTTSPLM